MISATLLKLNEVPIACACSYTHLLSRGAQGFILLNRNLKSRKEKGGGGGRAARKPVNRGFHRLKGHSQVEYATNTQSIVTDDIIVRGLHSPGPVLYHSHKS